ncbi:DUF397 domain-containing protein [Streptomyces werraensis]|uniref:DUF397 domain-containing protein n=1 Tax=Streptomyces werraensis TaxID=68284 RepID=UPI0037D5D108
MSNTHLEWFKSSYSGSDGDNCVEVAVDETIHVRDSKQREDGQLSLSPAAWSAFITHTATAQV